MKKHSFWNKTVAIFLCMILGVSPIQSSLAQLAPALTTAGILAPSAHHFYPVNIKGIVLDQHNPLRFNFLINSGDADLDDDALTAETQKLAKYFLASLTVPDEDLWVNLSPYEGDRIIPEALSQTDLGRDLLEQDFFLKQFTSSLLHPDSESGERFWKRVYVEASRKFGTTNIPVDTFHKVWIVPEKAVVMERGHGAFVVERHLKVMLEKDYLAASHAESVEQDDLSSQVMREVIIPAIEEEVNYGKHFATLRQVYNAMILAQWYKKSLQNTLLGKLYANQNKVQGIDLAEKDIKEKIYQEYVEGYQKGVFDFIREGVDPVTKESLPRHYFSGGILRPDAAIVSVPSTQSIPQEYAAVISRSPAGDLLVPVEMVENMGPDAIVASSSPVDRTNDENSGLLGALGRWTLSILCAGAVGCGGGSETPQPKVDAEGEPTPARTETTPAPSVISPQTAKAFNGPIAGPERVPSETYQQRFQTVVNNSAKSFWGYAFGNSKILRWKSNSANAIDLSRVVNDGVFRLVASGTEGETFQITFEDDQGRTVIFDTSDDTALAQRPQRLSVELKTLRAQNPQFNWGHVKPPVIKANTNRAGRIVISRMDVIDAPHRNVGLGLLTNNIFQFEQLQLGNSATPESVLSFTNLGTDPQQTLNQWNQLRSVGKIPHEVFEFADGDDPSGYNPQLLIDIANGVYDAQLTAKAEAAKQFGDLVLMRTLHEALGGWYPWSIKTLADADNYIRAWKHIYQLYQQAGATNVAFGFSPHEYNPVSLPQEAPYQITEYIVRALQNEIHFIGIDAYSRPENQYTSLNVLITGLLEALGKYNIPIILGEMSYGEPVNDPHPQRNQRFWDQVVKDLKQGKYPGVVAMTVFSTIKEETNRLMTFVPTPQAKQTLATDSFFRFDGDWADVLRAKPGVVSRISSPFATPAIFLNSVVGPVRATTYAPYNPNWEYDPNNKLSLTSEIGLTRVAWSKKSPNEWVGTGNEPGVPFAFESLLMPIAEIKRGTKFNIVLEDASNPDGNGKEVRLPIGQLESYIVNDVLVLRRSDVDRGQDFDWNNVKQFKFEPVSESGSVLLGQPVFNDKSMVSKQAGDKSMVSAVVKKMAALVAVISIVVLGVPALKFYQAIKELGLKSELPIDQDDVNQKQIDLVERSKALDAYNKMMRYLAIRNAIHAQSNSLHEEVSKIGIFGDYDVVRETLTDEFDVVLSYLLRPDVDETFVRYLTSNRYFKDAFLFFIIGRDLKGLPDLPEELVRQMVTDNSNDVHLEGTQKLIRTRIDELFDNRGSLTLPALTSVIVPLGDNRDVVLYEELVSQISQGLKEYPVSSSIEGMAEYTTFADFVLRSFARNPRISLELRQRMAEEHPHLIDELVFNPSITYAEIVRYGQERELPLERVETSSTAFDEISNNPEEWRIADRMVAKAKTYNNPSANVEADPIKVFLIKASNLAFNGGQKATNEDVARVEEAQPLFEQWSQSAPEEGLGFEEPTGNMSNDVEALITTVGEQLNGGSKEVGQGDDNDIGVADNSTQNPGGIALNPELMDLQILRDDNGMPLSLDQQPLDIINIEGLFPVIISITPVNMSLVLSQLIQDGMYQGDVSDPYQNDELVFPLLAIKEN